MIELSREDPKPISPFPRQYRAMKRWVIAERRKNHDLQTKQNAALETDYHRVINIAKSLYLKPDEVYFERDYKRDKKDGIFGMHSFLTPTFWWRLDCSLAYEYVITLAFNNCPFEEEVRKLLRAYPLDRGVQEKQLQREFDAYYKSVLSIQEQRFIHSLQGN